MSKRDCFKALGIKSLSDEFESSVVDGMTDEEIRDLGTKIALNYYNKLDKDLVKLKKSVGLKVKESPIVYEPPKRSEKSTQQSGDVQGDKEARTQPSDVDELTDLTEFEKSLTDDERRSIEEGEADFYQKLEEAARLEADLAYEQRQQELEEINRSSNIPIREEFDGVTITEEELARFGDKNWLDGVSPSMKRSLLSEGGTPLDVQLQEISESIGREVEIDEFMDYLKAKIDGELSKSEKEVKSFSDAVSRNLDSGLLWLDDLESRLDEATKNTLGMNLPVPIAKMAIAAAKSVLRSAKFGMKVADVMSEATMAAIKAVVNSDWYKSLSRYDQLEAVIAANKLLHRGGRVDVKSETEGLTQEEQTKQGLVEIIEAYKDKIKEARRKAKALGDKKVAEIKGKERSRRDQLEKIRRQLISIIETELPKGIKVPKAFVKAVAKAKTPRALEIISDKIDSYIESATKGALKKEIRGKVRKASKKLNSTSEFTNKASVISNLINVDLSGASVKELTDLSNILDDVITKPISKIRTAQIENIVQKVGQKEKKEPSVPDKESLGETIKNANDNSKTPKERQRILNRAQRALNTGSDKSSRSNVSYSVKEVADLQEKIDKSQEQLDKDTKEYIKELNKESAKLLSSEVDYSTMTADQRKDVEELKRLGSNNSYKYAELLNAIAVELSFGYAPMKSIRDYINSVRSDKNAIINADTVERTGRARNKRFTEIVSSNKFLNFITPNFVKLRGVDSRSLNESVRELQLQGWQFWDRFFGTGKAQTIYKKIINPLIESKIVKSFDEATKDYLEYKKLAYKGLNKSVKEKSKKKILMAMMQGYWNDKHGGASYWGNLINDPTLANKFPNEVKEARKLYDEMPKESLEVDGEVVERVDVEGYLNGLKGAERKLYDWIVENNKKYGDRQQAANERRGQKYTPEDSRYYFPLVRLNETTQVQMDNVDEFVLNAINQANNPNASIKSTAGKERTSGNISPISLDMDALINKQVRDVNRDYYLYESFREALKTVGKMKNRVSDVDANKYISALEIALPQRLKSEYNNAASAMDRFVNNIFSAVYQNVLVSFTRLPVEFLVESFRTIGATEMAGVSKALEMKVKDPLGRGVRFIMEQTGSPFLKNIFIESLEEMGRSPMSRTVGGRLMDYSGKVSENIMGMPDDLTFGNVWSPSFFAEFERQANKPFDVRAFKSNPEKYYKENSLPINRASSYADGKTMQIKGSKTKAGRRQLVKIVPDWVAKAVTFGRVKGGAIDVNKSATASRIFTFLQNFAFLEQLMISVNANNLIYSEDKSRAKAIREMTTAFVAGSAYSWLMSYLYADDEEDLKRLTSFEGVMDSAYGNATFLAGGRFGNTSKMAILLLSGSYARYLKQKGGSAEELKNLEEITRSRYYSAPLDLSEYKSTADFYKALLPMMDRIIKDVRTLSNDGVNVALALEKKASGEQLTDDELSAVQLVSLANNIQKLAFTFRGKQIPFQKEVDRAIRDLKKGTSSPTLSKKKSNKPRSAFEL